MTTTVHCGCSLEYQVKKPTTFLLNLSAAQTDYQRVVTEKLTSSPNLELQSFELGLEQNRVQRLQAVPGTLRLEYRATVELNAVVEPVESLEEQAYRELPPSAIPYLNPSRYCESDMLSRFANSEFGEYPHGYSRVKAICDWTFEHLAYASGSTHSQTTARDVLVQRQGVCRDFAHLSISLCRGLGIPARYVSGYAVDLEPPDFHGFFEAFLSDRWFLFDATRLAPVQGLVRIASGHDAADVPFCTLIGDAKLQSKQVWARTHTLEAIHEADGSEQAVSTAAP